MSSVGEIAVTIRAVNEATPTFEAVSSDAARMGSQVRASATAFDEMRAHAESCNISLLTVARGISSVGMLGSHLITLAADFGLVDRESAKWMRTITHVITLLGIFVRVQHYITVLTSTHTAAVATNTTMQTANASSSLLVAAAHKVKAAATWLAVHAQNALNISHATFLALTGVGIGVIMAAAAAMAMFASQMNTATESVKEYNAAVSEMAGRTVHVRTVVRADEEMYRRGVEP